LQGLFVFSHFLGVFAIFYIKKIPGENFWPTFRKNYPLYSHLTASQHNLLMTVPQKITNRLERLLEGSPLKLAIFAHNTTHIMRTVHYERIFDEYSSTCHCWCVRRRYEAPSVWRPVAGNLCRLHGHQAGDGLRPHADVLLVARQDVRQVRPRTTVIDGPESLLQ